MAASDSTHAAMEMLEQQVSELIALCERLVTANRVLLEKCDELQQQTLALQRKNREAGDTIERTLKKLKPFGDS